MKRPFAMLTATAHAVPKRVFKNDEFKSIGIDTTDARMRPFTREALPVPEIVG